MATMTFAFMEQIIKWGSSRSRVPTCILFAELELTQEFFVFWFSSTSTVQLEPNIPTVKLQKHRARNQVYRFTLKNPSLLSVPFDLRIQVRVVGVISVVEQFCKTTNW